MHELFGRLECRGIQQSPSGVNPLWRAFLIEQRPGILAKYLNRFRCPIVLLDPGL